MKKKIKTILLLVTLTAVSCNEDTNTINIFSEKKSEKINAEQLRNKVKASDNSILVLNYWATWCKPCFAELKELDRIQKEFADKNVVVYTVNIDRASDKVKKALIDYHYRQLHYINHKYISVSDTEEIMTVLENEWVEIIPVTYVFYRKLKKPEIFIGAASITELTAYLQKVTEKY